ncbi:Na-translocating system protein MpsC family protein [Siminovitchia sediminis]|uniref:Na-translocating system protein MpsC family protein n=1 Tax=Siminovitchia sediminis TaxID=1274353 RepID=A0ABW4KFV8_9BACI
MNGTSTEIEIRTLKRDIAQVYNRVNQEFYATGVRSQRVDIQENRVIIFAKHKRVTAFKALSQNFWELTTYADAALIVEFKAKFRKIIEDVTGMKVLSVLKDYDPDSEEAVCVIIFDQKIT